MAATQCTWPTGLRSRCWFDFSSVGLAKAQALAEKHQVKIECLLADLNEFQLELNAWHVVVSVFSQPESPIRQRLNAQLPKSLRVGGALIHESKVSAEDNASGKYPGVEILQGGNSAIACPCIEPHDRSDSHFSKAVEHSRLTHYRTNSCISSLNRLN